MLGHHVGLSACNAPNPNMFAVLIGLIGGLREVLLVEEVCEVLVDVRDVEWKTQEGRGLYRAPHTPPTRV